MGPPYYRYCSFITLLRGTDKKRFMGKGCQLVNWKLHTGTSSSHNPAEGQETDPREPFQGLHIIIIITKCICWGSSLNPVTP